MSEPELNHRATAYIPDKGLPKVGHAVVTPEQLAFFDQRFAGGGAGGALGALIGGKLQQRHEEGGPLLSIELADITGARREKKLLNKDRIAITTAGGEYLFNDGWNDWDPILRQTLSERYGRRIVDDGGDRWHVEAP